MANLKNTEIDDTGFLKTASGTTAQRPGCAQAGDLRYNTDEGYHEMYNGSSWKRWGDLTAFVTATGGTITTCGDYKIHTFTSSGTFTVTCAGNPLGSTTVDYMVVAGGGGAGKIQAGGGGAGGFRESVPNPAAWTASPLANSGGSLPVTATGYPVTVGGGGAGMPVGCVPFTPGTPGVNSVFSTITSTGGGGGGFLSTGASGGSGGGGGEDRGGGAGNTPPVSPPQGNNGGQGNPPTIAGGGGGGAGAVGATSPSYTVGGPGGNGVQTSINGSATYYGGGGGGGPGDTSTSPTGGLGGGGPASSGGGTPGTANTGGGGGSNDFPVVPGTFSGSGGSGIVIIRYKFQ